MREVIPEVVSPEALESQLSEDVEIGEKIRISSEAIVTICEIVGNKEDIPVVRNVANTLINQEEILSRLYRIYEEIFSIWQRLRSIMTRSAFDKDEKQVIQKRAGAIIGENIFFLQREVFFKIVNAKEVAEGEKNEDGPALLFPNVEKAKNSILRNIQAKTLQLKPTALDICKSFEGIASKYVETEVTKPGEKPRFDTIAQCYEQEKEIRTQLAAEISLSQMDNMDFLTGLWEGFEKLKKTYQLKIKSLQDKDVNNVINFDQKVTVLEQGFAKAEERLKPLRVLRNLAKKLPELEKQLDFFAESHYQAKAVMRFLEEVNNEMSKVFREYTLESFSVVSFLRYKLNGTSHMFESIYYYYAVVQIENDIKASLEKRCQKEEQKDLEAYVNSELSNLGISKMVIRLHNYIAEMNEGNYAIHVAFLDYKENGDLESLRRILSQQTERINKVHSEVKVVYRNAQKLFLNFLAEDLGSTDLLSQFNNFLRAEKENKEAEGIRKSFAKLLTTKRNRMEALEKELRIQFGEKIDPQKISAMAQLKIRKDFQLELLKEIQESPRAQDVYLHILKEFIKIQDDFENGSQDADNSIVWLVLRDFQNELAQFKLHETKLFKRVLQSPSLSERDLAVCFLASNITPQEIESFSRLLPALPRNELQLDSPYGRMLLDIRRMHQERLSAFGGSVAYVSEKIYEKRERIKLISNICLFFRDCTEPFYKKIGAEESKVNHLISLQKRKYQKELNEVIKYWYYLVQDQIEPGQGERGRFRAYKEDEKQLMMKYISPEQVDNIERQLQSSYDLAGESRLFEVESFLMEIVQGLFKNFEWDLRIKAVFENHEKGKKIKTRQYQNEEYQKILEGPSFAPNIKACIKRVQKVKRRNIIGQYLDYWDFLIDKEVPSSDKRSRKFVEKPNMREDSDNSLHYLTPEHLNRIDENIELIGVIRDPEIQKQLSGTGVPLLNIARQSFKIFRNDGKSSAASKAEEEHRKRMVEYCQNKELEKKVLAAIEMAG